MKAQKSHGDVFFLKSIALIITLQVYLSNTCPRYPSNQCFSPQSKLSRLLSQLSFGSYDLQLLINPYDSHFSHHQPLSDASQSPIPAYCSSQYLFLLSHDISYLKQSNKNRCSHHNTHNNRHQRFRRIQKRGT